MSAAADPRRKNWRDLPDAVPTINYDDIPVGPVENSKGRGFDLFLPGIAITMIERGGTPWVTIDLIMAPENPRMRHAMSAGTARLIAEHLIACAEKIEADAAAQADEAIARAAKGGAA